MFRYKNHFILLFCLFLGISAELMAQRPATSQRSATNPVKVYTKANKETGEVSFFAMNPGYSPYQLEVDFTELYNYQPSVNLPYHAVLQPDNNEVHLFSIKPKEAGKMGFKVRYIFEHGDPAVTPDMEFNYLLPFTHGTKHKMTQGYGGNFSHADKYALDFAMEVGTPVTAVRDGIVVDMHIDSDRGGPDKSFAGEGNYILVYHEDGSYATYSHLRKNGTLKKLGDKVKAGEHFAFSGNTGWSVGPHLHLEILKPEKMKIATFPSRFITHDKSAVGLKEGKMYYAIHPGKPSFRIEEPKDALPTADGAVSKKQTKVETNNKIEVVDKEVDGVIYFYLRNGYSAAKQVALKFDMDNIKPLEKLTSTVQVPANTEIYLFSAKVDNPAKPANFGFSITTR